MIFSVMVAERPLIVYTKKNSSSHGADIPLLNQTTGVSKNIFTDTVPSGGISFSPDNKKFVFHPVIKFRKELFIPSTSMVPIFNN